MADKPGFKSFKPRIFKRLNDIHISAQVTVRALEQSQIKKGKRKPTTSGRFEHFQVPSGIKPTARIRRERRDIEDLVERAIGRTVFENALVIAVSIVEDYAQNLMTVMLRAFPKRLIRGKDANDGRKVTLEDFLSDDREAILHHLIDERIHKVMFDRPVEQFDFLGQVTGIRIDPQIVGRYVEIKATRDVIVHASGRANARYFEKAGELARGDRDALIRIDRDYFDSAFATMKALIGDIHDQATAKYSEDDSVLKHAANLLA